MSQVNHPAHYNQGKIEVIEFLEDKFMSEPHLWNAVKYLARAGKKDPSKFVEDCEKAIWYIRRRIELHQTETPRRPNEMAEKLQVANMVDCQHDFELVYLDEKSSEVFRCRICKKFFDSKTPKSPPESTL